MGPALAIATSRYASLQALFWIGTFIGCALALRTRRTPHRALAGALLAALLLAGLVANQRLGFHRLTGYFNRARWLPVAALALRWEVHDRQVLAHASPFIPPRSIRFLRRLGHVPFDRPPAGPPGAEIGLPPDADGVSATGVWTTTHELPRRAHLRVSGSLPDGQGGQGSILLVDRNGRVRGAAVVLPEAGRGLGLLIGRRPPARSWIGYLKRRHLAEATPVFLPESGPAFRLGIAAEARSPIPVE
jgi:hypothetical protein